jgi:membrane associated rhomboid family serine protease
MIPLRVDTTSERIPYVTILLGALCVAAYVYRLEVARYGYGIVPLDLMHALLHPSRQTGVVAMQLVLAFFMHAGVAHLVSNMWYLWIFGATLEYAVGALPFTLLYVGCGVLSMMIQAASSPLSNIPVVGASGAIAGVMGACLVLMPLARIITWIPLLFFIRIPSFIFLAVWFALQYISMRGASAQGSGVAWWAHMGGFACGLLMGLEIRRRGWKPPERRRKTRRAAIDT